MSKVLVDLIFTLCDTCNYTRAYHIILMCYSESTDSETWMLISIEYFEPVLLICNNNMSLIIKKIQVKLKIWCGLLTAQIRIQLVILHGKKHLKFSIPNANSTSGGGTEIMVRGLKRISIAKLYISIAVLGIKLRTPCMVGKCSPLSYILAQKLFIFVFTPNIC